MTFTFAFRGVLYRMTSPLHHEFAGVTSGEWDAFNAFSGQSNCTNYLSRKRETEGQLGSWPFRLGETFSLIVDYRPHPGNP